MLYNFECYNLDYQQEQDMEVISAENSKQAAELFVKYYNWKNLHFPIESDICVRKQGDTDWNIFVVTLDSTPRYTARIKNRKISR